MNWEWIRIVDGIVCSDAARFPMTELASVSAIISVVKSGLPAPVRWMRAKRNLSVHDVLRAFVAHSHFSYSTEVKKILRAISPNFSDEESYVSGLRQTVSHLCEILGVSVYVQIRGKATFVRGPVEVTGPVALISFMAGTCGLAMWTKASITDSMTVRAGSQISVNASTPLARVRFYWEKLTPNMKYRFRKNGVMLHPQHLWCFNMVSIPSETCSAAICDSLNVKSPDVLRPTISQLQGHLLANGVSADVMIVRDDQTLHIPALHSNSAVTTRLVCIRDHVSLGVLLKEDDTNDYYPPTACAQLTLMGDQMDYANYEKPGTWTNWKQLYVGEDHDRLTPETWSSWDDINTRLDEHFGSDYPVFQAGVTEEQRRDKRVSKLAGWASYHRTQVRVIYKDQGCFVLLPDVAERVHARAKPGRQIVVQLGDDGARHWFATMRGHVAYNKVYTNGFVAGQLEE